MYIVSACAVPPYAYLGPAGVLMLREMPWWTPPWGGEVSMGFIETLNARAERHVFRLPLHTLTAADTGSSTPYDAVEGGRGGIPHSPYLVDERPRGSSSAALRATPMAASDHLRARRLAAPPAANRPGGKRYDLLHALDADFAICCTPGGGSGAPSLPDATPPAARPLVAVAVVRAAYVRRQALRQNPIGKTGRSSGG